MTLKDKIAKARELSAGIEFDGALEAKYRNFAAHNLLSLANALEKCLEFIVNLQKYECDSTYAPDCNGCRLHEKSFDFLNDLEPSEELTKERE